MEFIEATIEQEINWNLSDCSKLEKEIEKLKERLSESIRIYNTKADFIHKSTNKYTLSKYKLTLKKQ